MGRVGFNPPGIQLTLLQPGEADYAHHITASSTRFENPAASLRSQTLAGQIERFWGYSI